MEATKRCSRCREPYPATLEYFQKDKRNKDGLQGMCKVCRRIYYPQHRLQHKQYYKEHSQEIRQKQKRYSQEHRQERNQRRKQYYATLRGYLRETYRNMLHRCNNPKNKRYKNYGGRGIEVRFGSFVQFYDYVVKELKADPRGLTIDRIDNDGHYERGNIRFVTRAENLRNRKRSYKRNSRLAPRRALAEAKKGNEICFQLDRKEKYRKKSNKY